MTNRRLPDPGDSGQERPDEAAARAGLRRLAEYANTEPSRRLGVAEVVTETANAGRGERFAWRRLAVAAGVVALVGGGVLALNQRSGDSTNGSSADPSTGSTTTIGDPGAEAPGAGFPQSLAAGFGPVPDAAADAGRYAQHQYAENADRPETGRFVTVTDAPVGGLLALEYGYVDFYPSFEPWMVGAATPTTDPPPAPPTTEPGWATTVPGEPFAATSEPDRASEAAIVRLPDTASEPGAPAAPVAQCQFDADPDGALSERQSIIGIDDGTCRMVTVTEVGGSAVVVLTSGLSDDEVQAVVSNLVPAPDGFGHVVDLDALPEGLSEIAAGSITNMFEPRPAIAETHRVELVWTYQSPRGNPVLDEAGLAEAKIVAIVDGDTGLGGQRLLYAEVRDAVVGDDPAVVQIAPIGSVRVVWRHEGTLFMYEEEMANADDTVRRANELLPFFLAELADGQYSPPTPAPTTTVPECGPWSGTTPANDGAANAPACDWPTGTYPEDSIPPDYFVPTTTYPDDWPGAEDPETTTTSTWPATTTTYPGQGDDWSTTTVPEDWSTSTYPGQDDDWSTTTYPGQGDDRSAATTYPDYGDVAPEPPVTVPPPPSPAEV